jgi:hypothetical protein
LNKSRFLWEEHAWLGQEAVAQRWVMELTHELEAARVLVLHEHGRTTAAEQELATCRSALGAEQAALEAERVVRAFAEGQPQSRGQRIAELEVTLSQREEGSRLWRRPRPLSGSSHPFGSILRSVASDLCFVYVQSWKRGTVS